MLFFPNSFEPDSVKYYTVIQEKQPPRNIEIKENPQDASCRKFENITKKHQLTQAQMAVLLEVDRSAYSCYETGKTRPDYEKLIKISRFYQVSIDDLLLAQFVE